ncbi:MAG: glycosyltransferase family 39 protein [Actinomycetota bacterium]
MLAARWFPLGVTACAVVLAAFFLAVLHAWPPHEDEALALFVGRDSLGGLLQTVHAERGGAPLHFLVAWVVVHLGGGLTALRLASALFAVASVPVLAMLSARLAGRRVAIVAVMLASASWLVLFHGVYGRMYSLFLLTSALSYLALLVAVERDDRGRWALWALATLATIASHPYGALVLASEGVFVLARARTKRAFLAMAIVTLAATPFWLTDRVLADRLDAGVGEGGDRLPVLGYLADAAGDASSGFLVVLVPVLALALYGSRRLRPPGALLVGCVVVVPAAVLGVAHFGDAASPESRHLIFILPFFSTALAAGLVALFRPRLAVAAAVAILIVAEVGWAWHRTPALFEGESSARIEARDAASAWLASSARPTDVLFGFDPVFLGAWKRDRNFPATVVPRADAKLAVSELEGAGSVGRGVWVLDAGDTNNRPPRSTIPMRLPEPARAFEGRVFGPYLVLRTREQTRTPARYLTLAAAAMRLGTELGVVDANGNLHTILVAESRLG